MNSIVTIEGAFTVIITTSFKISMAKFVPCIPFNFPSIGSFTGVDSMPSCSTTIIKLNSSITSPISKSDAFMRDNNIIISY